MWKSVLLAVASLPASLIAFGIGWASTSVRVGVVAGLSTLFVCWALAIVLLLFTRRFSAVDVFLPVPIAILWSMMLFPLSLGTELFTAPSCIGSAVVLSVCLWMIRHNKMPVTWAILPAVIFLYEMLPINVPGPFDDWFAFGGDVTVLLFQGLAYTLKPRQVPVDPGSSLVVR